MQKLAFRGCLTYKYIAKQIFQYLPVTLRQKFKQTNKHVDKTKFKLFSQEVQRRYAFCGYFIDLLSICKPWQVSLLLWNHIQLNDSLTQPLGLPSSVGHFFIRINSLSCRLWIESFGFISIILVCIPSVANITDWHEWPLDKTRWRSVISDRCCSAISCSWMWNFKRN